MGAAESSGRPSKVVRSYRLVFHRRWRIFRIQNWRIPLPGGLELRAIGYWLACVALVGLLGALPLVGLVVGMLPASVRLAALPLLGAWALSSWELDGRSPHRALVGIAGWRLRPRTVAALRRCPAPGPLPAISAPTGVGADLAGPSYPRGRLRGPVRVLLRYPVEVRVEGVPRSAGCSPPERRAAAARWRVRGTGGGPLHRGALVAVPAGRVVIFE